MHSAIQFEKSIYVFGGFDQANNNVENIEVHNLVLGSDFKFMQIQNQILLSG